MSQIKIIDKIKFESYEIPIIEGGFGSDKRIILVKTVCDIYNLRVADINKFINNNIEEFKFGEDIIDIKEELLKNEVLRENLKFSRREVSGNTKKIYILSEKGFIKLRMLKKLKTKKSSNDEILNQFIEDYFFMRKHLKRYLDENGVKRIFKAAENNAYIKEINRSLVTPRGKKGIMFKSTEVENFKKKVNKDMEKFLFKYLDIRNLNEIPIAYLDSAMDLLECYTLSEELKLEFYEISKKLSTLRFEVIEENKIKNVLYLESIKAKIREIKGLLLK
ncbi:hypothetical protein CBU02nite_26090 [Clostridium butyricum]|jgi:hypothetical protein|uniref:KilA-N DNA-binding domain-containing protein n=1 Tax=Clostridium butyricum TaxID=1492 RepID=A0A512TPS4_CLOBU|nr:ORF6N domain-containing protein [Clostridium butyricum]NOW24888.1 hypothetical protein [Clostridium butyricum]GEQ22103.1 hypothetical protein CBU02nite_26090 [Clostridium butyricum]